jgi:2-succinyl-5-enolpyruvyl-6-hydroxy-3-cyclohexene-1-carboxylate synthase
MYGFDYCMANTEETLEACLVHFFEKSDQPRLLEVFTPRQLNDEVLLNYFKEIK